MQRTTAMFISVLILAVSLSGCKVTIDRDLEGHDKVFKIDTPFGHFHVNTDQTTASDVGLPVYPGAQMIHNNDNHDSAAVDFGFGSWQMEIKAVSFSSPDSKEKIAAFYKKALSKYGSVMTCQGKIAVGKPTTTPDGLSCDDENYSQKIHINTGTGKDGINVNTGASKDSLQLRVGSKEHQHLVGFENSADDKTHFALVALDKPSDAESGK